MATAKDRLHRKYRAVQEEFKRLYHNDGLRTDRIYEILDAKFYLGESSIKQIMKITLPNAEEEEKDPAQKSLFE